MLLSSQSQPSPPPPPLQQYPHATHTARKRWTLAEKLPRRNNAAATTAAGYRELATPDLQLLHITVVAPLSQKPPQILLVFCPRFLEGAGRLVLLSIGVCLDRKRDIPFVG